MFNITKQFIPDQNQISLEFAKNLKVYSYSKIVGVCMNSFLRRLILVHIRLNKNNAYRCLPLQTRFTKVQSYNVYMYYYNMTINNK